MSFNTNLSTETIDKIAKSITSNTIETTAYIEINFFAHSQIYEILRIAILYCEYLNQNVVNEYCILKAFPEKCYSSFLLEGYNIYQEELTRIDEIQDEKMKKRALKKLDKTYALYIDTEFFQTTIFFISKEIKSGLQFTREALIYFQFYIEYNIKLLIGYANYKSFKQNNVINTSDLMRSMKNFEYQLQINFSDSELNISPYIFKVLKQVRPDVGITNDSLFQLTKIISLISSIIINKSYELALIKQDEQICSEHIRISTLMILNNDLGKYGVSEGKKSVFKFCNYMEEDKTRAKNSNLIFNVRIFEKMFNVSVTNQACIFLTSVIEYLTAEFLELSGNVCKNEKEYNITPYHLQMSCSLDKEMFSLLKRIGFRFVCGKINIPMEFSSRKFLPTIYKFSIDDHLSKIVDETEIEHEKTQEEIPELSNISFKKVEVSESKNLLKETFEYQVEDFDEEEEDFEDEDEENHKNLNDFKLSGPSNSSLSSAEELVDLIDSLIEEKLKDYVKKT